MNRQTVYIISGPAGVGKSTTAKQLVKQLPQSAYIAGDYISHMHVNGREKPWESKEEVTLIWTNIVSLTRSFLQNKIDVVIDYVTFPEEAEWINEKCKDLQVDVKYIVLWTDHQTLLKRDHLREPDARMKERCIVLADEFSESGLDGRHILINSTFSEHDLSEVLIDIIRNENYLL